VPLTPQSEPRRKSNPRWVLAFWLVVIGFRMWFQNRTVALAFWALALLALVVGRRRNATASGTAPAGPEARSIETITMPAPVLEARPIEPEIGGASGKLLVFAIVVLALALLGALLWKRLR